MLCPHACRGHFSGDSVKVGAYHTQVARIVEGGTAALVLEAGAAKPGSTTPAAGTSVPAVAAADSVPAAAGSVPAAAEGAPAGAAPGVADRQ